MSLDIFTIRNTRGHWISLGVTIAYAATGLDWEPCIEVSKVKQIQEIGGAVYVTLDDGQTRTPDQIVRVG